MGKEQGDSGSQLTCRGRHVALKYVVAGLLARGWLIQVCNSAV